MGQGRNLEAITHLHLHVSSGFQLALEYVRGYMCRFVQWRSTLPHAVQQTHPLGLYTEKGLLLPVVRVALLTARTRRFLEP